MESSGLLMYDQSIVVLASMQLEMLDRIHEAHQGITKCRARARCSLWWPMMSAQIQEMVANCRTCQRTSPTPTKLLLPLSLPDCPWERIGADLFEFMKTQYLLLVGYYSRWIKVTRLTSTSSQATIEKCKAIFATHIISEMLLSDNSPQFASAEFSKFTIDYGFTNITSSPRDPRVNGEAVGTIKCIWEKCKDPFLTLLTYHTAPLENGYTPSELLMTRMLQTTLPNTKENLTMMTVDREAIRDREERGKDMAKKNHDERHQAKHLSTLSPGQRVWIRDMEATGTIGRQVAPRSYTVSTNNGTIRRNRRAYPRSKRLPR